MRWPCLECFQAELAALTEELGREIRVFPTITTPTSDKAPSNLTSHDGKPPS